MADRHDSDKRDGKHAGDHGDHTHAAHASLDGLRKDALSEVDQEAAARKADESAEAARRATAARISFESQQKDQARKDAVEAQARADADRSARENYDALLKQEDEAHKQAAADSRAAGRDWDGDAVRNGEVI
jgi:hypothetical protein